MPAAANMHELLLSLPLFQGMGRADLNEVLTSTRFDFQQCEAGGVVVADGERCDRLFFLIKGRLRVVGEAHDHGYSLTEHLAAPALLQPERLFGLHQRYTKSFYAEEPCQLLCLHKQEVARLSDCYPIFRINLLNIVCTQSQRQQERTWQHLPASLRQRIVRFFESHCLRPAGEKTFHIKMVRLADELNDRRLNVSRVLNQLQAEGLLVLGRGRICIPAMERLIQAT